MNFEISMDSKVSEFCDAFLRRDSKRLNNFFFVVDIFTK